MSKTYTITYADQAYCDISRSGEKSFSFAGSTRKRSVSEIAHLVLEAGEGDGIIIGIDRIKSEISLPSSRPVLGWIDMLCPEILDELNRVIAIDITLDSDVEILLADLSPKACILYAPISDGRSRLPYDFIVRYRYDELPGPKGLGFRQLRPDEEYFPRRVSRENLERAMRRICSAAAYEIVWRQQATKRADISFPHREKDMFEPEYLSYVANAISQGHAAASPDDFVFSPATFMRCCAVDRLLYLGADAGGDAGRLAGMARMLYRFADTIK